MSEGKKWVRRTQYLINRGFQLRYMGVFVGAAFLTSLVIGGVLYYIVEINWVLQVERGLHLVPEASVLLDQQRFMILMTFFVSLFVLGGVLSLWGLFLSHRVAGPVFALSRRMQNISLEQDLVTPLYLREKDSLKEVRDFLNETMKTWAQEVHEEILFWRSIGENCKAATKEHPDLEEGCKHLGRKIEAFIMDKEKWLRTNHL
ncbi:MAG: hypothetical protein A3B70_03720 [Deltaproteobacteria bacterium RIFCSPHIGHO2_02_FULL_40_11]|nr:MAG: hypothetical protein A3B70_03720 [Deltaproteobacteria bacterium RIFCSPHIGHO2_02_FULL_40_11]